MAGWEEYALLRAPTQASLDTLPSEALVRVGGPAGSADQNGSRGPNNLALGAGIVYGTFQALAPFGFASPSPASDVRDFEAGRGWGMMATGLLMFMEGLKLSSGGLGLDSLAFSGASLDRRTRTVAVVSGTVAAVGGGALAAHGGINATMGYNILLMSAGKSDDGSSNHGNSQSNESKEIKHVYNGIKEAPGYPRNFKSVQNGTTRNTVDRKDLLGQLRKIEQGDWHKIYKDGYVGNERVSLHYFESRSGKVFAFRVVWRKWSNQ